MTFVEPGRLDMILRLRSRGISDTNVLRAMEKVQRSVFVDPENLHESYSEKPLPIACGQTLPAPLTVAILCQTLGIEPTDKVLLVGGGSGYTAAVVAQMCTRVYAVERYKTLVETVETLKREHGHNIVIKHGDGRLGWRGQAPFDKIMLCCSVRMLPTAMVTQLKTHGRIVAVIGDTLTIGERKHGRFKETPIMPMELPVMEPGKSLAL